LYNNELGAVVGLSSKELSLSQIEELGYYDFMAYLQVPFFNIGGAPSLDLLAERCKIDENSHVLDVGCGTGGNACHIAEKYGCKVTGIDIAEHMIEQANIRAQELGLTNRVSFEVADAYNLKYPEGTFDSVITVFVSQFLDIETAFLEFKRVLKKGGYLGVNEMFKADKIPAEAKDKVDYGEKVYKELTELPFSIRTPSEWESGFIKSGYEDINIETKTEYLTPSKSLEFINELGGLLLLFSLLWRVVRIGLRSSKIRARYVKMSRGKRVLLNDPISSKYIGYVIGRGRKP
jgi:ubiquinone/menaquinone biosynthesis C-methylase UbiE